MTKRQKNERKEEEIPHRDNRPTIRQLEDALKHPASKSHREIMAELKRSFEGTAE